MPYREDQRERVINYRDKIFRDPGNGIYRGIERPFVLRNARLNLWAGIREDAIDYFNRNRIVWRPGANEPTGHLLSSQIACVNHLYPLRQRPDLAREILKKISSAWRTALEEPKKYIVISPRELFSDLSSCIDSKALSAYLESRY